MFGLALVFFIVDFLEMYLVGMLVTGWLVGVFFLRNDTCICILGRICDALPIFFFSYQLFELNLPTFSTELPTSCSVQISTFFSSCQLFKLKLSTYSTGLLIGCVQNVL